MDSLGHVLASLTKIDRGLTIGTRVPRANKALCRPSTTLWTITIHFGMLFLILLLLSLQLLILGRTHAAWSNRLKE